MKEKVNVAELLKDCHKGMELDCTMFDDVTLEECTSDYIYIRLNNGELFGLSIYGNCIEFPISKCVIFPKGKTTWEGFVPPCQFKEGDIISDALGTCIYKGEGRIKGTVDYYCGIHGSNFVVKAIAGKPDSHYGDIVDYRFATEEEKQKLFDAIKANGYKWNAETRTLEKLIVPKFKVGDRIRGKISKNELVVGMIDEYYYYDKELERYAIENQDCYELVPNKFDISILKSFESRVLVRDHETGKWNPAIWGFYDKDVIDDYHYEVVGGQCFVYCIPYEGNEHLLGTTNDCDEYYKTW